MQPRPPHEGSRPAHVLPRGESELADPYALPISLAKGPPCPSPLFARVLSWDFSENEEGERRSSSRLVASPGDAARTILRASLVSAKKPKGNFMQKRGPFRPAISRFPAIEKSLRARYVQQSL